MDQKYPWYKDSEQLTNVITLVVAIIFGIGWANHKGDSEHFLENAAKGTFFVTFFGGFILRMIAGSNRQRVNSVIDSTRKLTEQVHQLVTHESIESEKTRQIILEISRTQRTTNLSFQERLPNISDQNQIDVAKENFDNALKNKDLSEIILSAKEYTDVVDRFAENIKAIEDIDIDVNVINLSIEVIQNIHRKFFPPQYEIAGKIRSVPVFINIQGHTALGPEGHVYTPPKPDKVLTLLEQLVRSWNEKASKLRQMSEPDKVELLAEFHAAFTGIHPFLDANGRVARILLKRQIKALFDKNVNPTFKDCLPEYYRSLKLANKGDISALKELIKHLL